MAYIPSAPDRIDAGNSTTTPLVSLAVTGASYSGSSLVLTGAWGTGGANAYVGSYFNVTGFTAAGVGNNQYAVCTASSAGSITLSMTGGYNGFTGSPIAAQAFTGAAVDCTAAAISTVNITCFSDQPSASQGMQLQWSTDNVNWNDHNQTDTAMASMSCVISDKVRARYYRVVHINGTTTQGVFRLQTLQSVTNTAGTVRDMDTLVQSDDESQLVRAVLTGQALVGASAGKFTHVLTDVYGSLQTVVGGQAADAFGRLRVASPVCLFDAQFQYDGLPLLMQTSTASGGTVAKTANESSLTLSTGGTTSGATAINQTKQYFRYQPGKSQQILMTGFLGAQKANVRSRIGYFDANDGVFFEMNGSDGAAVVQRTSTSGSPSDATRVLQANWNFDKMDGTGPSGITIDFSKCQVFAIDMQWLGVGRVRFGFLVNGTLVVCHQIFNANSITSPYMNTANLPCRAEIVNTGTAGSTTTMKQICMTVISEGGQDFPAGTKFSCNNGITAISVSTRRTVLSIRPKTTFNSIVNRGAIFLEDMGVLVGTGTVLWELVYNPTLTGTPSWASVDANSLVEQDIANTTLTGGIVIASGYTIGSSSGPTVLRGIDVRDIDGILPITLDITGAVQDILSVVCTAFTGSVSTNALLRWSEHR